MLSLTVEHRDGNVTPLRSLTTYFYVLGPGGSAAAHLPVSLFTFCEAESTFRGVLGTRGPRDPVDRSAQVNSVLLQRPTELLDLLEHKI